LHRLPHGRKHGALVLRCIDDDAALRLGAGDVAEGVAQLPVEGEVALLVGVGLGIRIDLVDPPAVRTPESQLGGNVEDKRQVRERRADHHVVQHVDDLARQAARLALVDAR
jgi:hypothetical protein